MELIVTDLTRFKNKNLLCMAAVNSTGECIRPMHEKKGSHPDYLSYDTYKEYNILPGMKISGEFHKLQNGRDGPHHEDRSFKNIKLLGPATSDEFKLVLQASSYSSFEEGFGTRVNDKVLVNAERSIFTLPISPRNLVLVNDGYENSKIRAHVTDNTGKQLRFLSVTDLGLFDYVANPETRRVSVDEANDFFWNQEILFLRIGLSGIHTAGERTGYWIQLNGVYSFPEYLPELRSY